MMMLVMLVMILIWNDVNANWFTNVNAIRLSNELAGANRSANEAEVLIAELRRQLLVANSSNLEDANRPNWVEDGNNHGNEEQRELDLEQRGRKSIEDRNELDRRNQEYERDRELTDVWATLVFHLHKCVYTHIISSLLNLVSSALNRFGAYQPLKMSYSI